MDNSCNFTISLRIICRKENDGKPKLTNEEVDNLWTILGYFNSKREFGRITHAITDEIPTRKIYATKAEDMKKEIKEFLKRLS